MKTNCIGLVWNSGKSKHCGAAKARQRRNFPFVQLGREPLQTDVGKATAVQTLTRPPDFSIPREAFGLRRIHRRFFPSPPLRPSRDKIPNATRPFVQSKIIPRFPQSGAKACHSPGFLQG
jgi:hypothetical protein